MAEETDATNRTFRAEEFLPDNLRLSDPQRDLPRIAKDPLLTKRIEIAVQKIPTHHALQLGDARTPLPIAPESVHLVLTSPPYWTLKQYRSHPAQMGHIAD